MPHPSHRHWVVLPFLMLSILGSGPASIPSGSVGIAAVTAMTDAEESVDFPSGAQAALSEGAELDVKSDPPELRQGSVLISTHAPLRLRAGAFTLLSAGGGFHVTKNGDAVTVVALTAPVLVVVGPARAAVPAGMQWRSSGESLALWESGIDAWMDSRAVTDLPKRFVAEQEERLHALAVQDTLPSPRAHLNPFAEATLPELSQARERRRDQWVEEILGVLRGRVEANDAAGVQEMLLFTDLAEALKSGRASEVASMLLFAAPRDIAMQQLLLPLLARDPDLWLLLSLHPAVSTVLWTLPAPSHDGEHAAVRLLSFPYADVGDEAANAAAWGRWEEALLAAIRASPDGESITNALVVRLGALALEREEGGYPARARCLARALASLAKGRTADLSPRAMHALAELSTLDRVATVDPPASKPEPDEHPAASSSVEKRFDGSAVEARARHLLQSAGAAFTLQTRIIPLNADRALVEHVVFAGRTRDHAFTFTLDVTRNAVLEIREGTTEYPYALPMEAFTEWIRK